jgi:hypothetical protein
MFSTTKFTLNRLCTKYVVLVLRFVVLTVLVLDENEEGIRNILIHSTVSERQKRVSHAFDGINKTAADHIRMIDDR